MIAQCGGNLLKTSRKAATRTGTGWFVLFLCSTAVGCSPPRTPKGNVFVCQMSCEKPTYYSVKFTNSIYCSAPVALWNDEERSVSVSNAENSKASYYNSVTFTSCILLRQCHVFWSVCISFSGFEFPGSGN